MLKPANTQRASRPIVTGSSEVAAENGGPPASSATPTIAELCTRYIAAQSNKDTAARYRWVLAPLTAHCGPWTAPDLTAEKWTTIEDAIADTHGAARASQVRCCLATALDRGVYSAVARWLRYGAEAPAPQGELLTLKQGAEIHSVAIASLRTLVDDGKVRHRGRRQHGRGESILFDGDELALDLANLPPCKAPRCAAPGSGPSGYCGEHFGQGGRARALETKDELFARRRDWWSVTEATRLAGGRVSRTRIQQAADRGEFPSEKVGRVRRIPRGPFRAWLKAQPTRGPSKPTHEESEALRQRVVELHSEGLGPVEIARKLKHSRQAVSGWLDRSGIERPGRGRKSRRLPPNEQEDRRQRHAALYRAGMSSRDVASETGSSQSQVLRDLDRLREPIRPKRRPAKYPPPAERPCEWCRVPFTPEFPAADMRGGQPKPRRFCSDRCAREWRAAQPRIELQKRGLLSVKAAGEQSRVGELFVMDLIDRGLLATERIEYPGPSRAHGIAPLELNHALRKWALEGDGRREAALNPDYAIARAERNGRVDRLIEHGMTREEAHDAIRRRVERKRDALRQRSKGPRPASGPSERDQRWLEQLLDLREEVAYHQQQLELGLVDDQDGERYREALAGERRSDYSLAKQIAERDWYEHPGDWPRNEYPPAPDQPDTMRPDMRRQAASKVLRAVQKVLQRARPQKDAP